MLRDGDRRKYYLERERELLYNVQTIYKVYTRGVSKLKLRVCYFWLAIL